LNSGWLLFLAIKVENLGHEFMHAGARSLDEKVENTTEPRASGPEGLFGCDAAAHLDSCFEVGADGQHRVPVARFRCKADSFKPGKLLLKHVGSADAWLCFHARRCS
jgi:hypothetical protein